MDVDAAWTETYRSLREVYSSVPEPSADLIVNYFDMVAGSEEEKHLRPEVAALVDNGDYDLFGFVGAVYGARILRNGLENPDSTPLTGEDEPGTGDAFDDLLAAFRSTPPTARQLQRAHAESELALLNRLNILVSQCSDAGELAELVRIYNDIPPVSMDEFETGEPPRWNLSDGAEPD